MPGNIPLDKCSLLSVFVESTLWGIFVPLYGFTVFLLVQKRSHIARQLPYLLLATAMLVLCTLHVALSFRRALTAFFGAASPVAYLLDATAAPSRVKRAVHVIQLVLGDALIVSRVFLLWDKHYAVAALPGLLVAGTLAAGAGALRARAPAAWLTALLALTLATKAVCLCLVAFRVRQIHAALTAHVDRHVGVYTAAVVLVEGGAPALLACAVLLPLFAAHRNAHYIVWDALSPLIGITFTLIIAGTTVRRTAHPAPPRPYSLAALPRPPPPRPEWRTYREEFAASPTSPASSRPASPQTPGKGSGTLNVTIVI